ncbi:MAG: c-type cytochrome [Pseudomonadota bacterium]
MNKIYFLILCFIPSIAFTGVNERSQANKIVTSYQERAGSAEEILSNPPFDIEDRTRVCGLCHGKDGNSTHTDIPSLAGQNPRYFVEQLIVFQNAGRYPKMMHDIAKKMDDETMVTIAVYYSTLPRLVTMPVDTSLDEQGKKLYTELCIHCHGEGATGANNNYASIRAQRPDYLTTTIKRLRNGDRKRTSHVMSTVVKGMSDQEITALANYIAGL